MPDGVLTGGHWYLVAYFTDSSSNDYLLSTVYGDSASTDTPASEPYRPYLQPDTVVDWNVYDTSKGWLDVGGVVKHKEIVFQAANVRDGQTNIGPLDDMQGKTFAGEPFILYAIDPVPRADGVGITFDDLANGTIIFRGTIRDSSFSGEARDTFSLTVREQTSQGLSVPSAARELPGLARGIAVETGGPAPGPELRRLAVSNTTGDQWWSWYILRSSSTATGAAFDIFTSGLARVQYDPSTLKINVDLKNSAGSWQTVGSASSISLTAGNGFLVNYDSATTTAELFVDGSSAGTTVITSGLNAAGSVDEVWGHTPASGNAVFTHFLYRRGTRELSSDEILDRSNFGWVPVNESNLTASVEFVEGTGTEIMDSANASSGGGISVKANNFASIATAWTESGTGEAAQAHTRPPVIVGRPFNAKLINVGVGYGWYSPGIEVVGTPLKQFRYVAADGNRLTASQAGHTGTFTFNNTTKEVSGFSMAIEPSVGQVLNFSAGPNAGNHTIDQIQIDPRITPNSTGTVRLSVAPTTDAGRAGTWTTTGSPSWTNKGSNSLASLITAEVLTGATDHMSGGFNEVATTRQLVAQYLVDHGPQSTPTVSNLSSSFDSEEYGWQGEGNATAFNHTDDLAKKTSSSDNGPSVVFRNSTGTYEVKGFQTAPSSADFTWDERRIRSATEKKSRRKFTAVRSRYSINWNPVERGLISSTELADPYSQESITKYREVVSGSGTELVLDIYHLDRQNAADFTSTLYDIVTTGVIYTIKLYGPITSAEAALEPFDVADVTWSADSFLSSGRKGTVVAWRLHSNNSATAVVLFIP